MTDEGNWAARGDEQITLSEWQPLPRGEGDRDARGYDRLWRIWKARHLNANPRVLSRLLGRRVD